MNVDETLKHRDGVYGDFREVAHVAQGLKRFMMGGRNWADLSDDKKEALQMIAAKIARILTGDPADIDSWHDISGYARLVELSLLKNLDKD